VIAIVAIVQASEPQSVIIAAVTAAVLAILAILIPGILAIIGALRKTQDTVKDVTAGQNKQLNKIEVLVDGRYGEVLQEIADLKLALSVATGLAADKIKAADAQTKADVQVERVRAATAKEEP